MYKLKDFLKHIQQTQKKVYCFGTGLMAEEALSYSEIQDATVGVIDNEVSKQGKKIQLCGREYSVYSPEQVISVLNANTVVLLTSGHYKAMSEQLKKLNISNDVEVFVYPVLKVSYTAESNEFFEQRILNECMKEYEVVLDQYHVSGKERVRMLEEKRQYILGESREQRPFVVPRMMVMPTTRCNLRCKGCSSLLPYFEKPEDVPVEQIIRDFKLFFSGIDECIRITVGGEPFLYPHLKEILEYLLAQKKVLGIMLITNSTIVPKPEVIELIKNEKVFVEVSDYGHLEKMSRLICLLEDNDVNFVVLTEQTWTDMGGIECRNRSEEELRFNYLNCDQGRVIKGIHNGRFHTCARSARMFALGAYSSEYDYFDLAEDDMPTVIRGKLKKMYYSDHADACNYCDLGALPTSVIEAGIQMRGTMKKSAYTIVNREEYEQLKRQAAIKG